MCVSESVVTHLNENYPKSQLVLQYNMASGDIRINGENISLVNKEYRITDLMGQIIRTGSFDSNDASVSVNELAEGMYLLSVEDNGKLLTERFVR